MTGVQTSFSLTQSDSIDQVIAEEFGNVPAEADSDSGDSLFITQRPVPQAVRSRRRRGFWLKSEDPEDLEESEEHDESEPDREKRRIKCDLPKYNFPFIAERKLKLRRTPLSDQNKSLLNYTIGGFFKCVGELRRSYQRGKDPKSCLPTVDVDGEDICPLSEEDKDGPEADDIKVVEKKCLVVLLKAKRQQTWCKATTVGPEASQGGQNKLLFKMPAKTSKSQVTPVTSVTESSDNDGNFLAQTEVPDTVLFLQNAREDELDDDSDATVCELRRSTQKGREASTPVTETQTERGEGQHESVEEGTGQNEEEPDGIQRQEERAIPVSKKKKKKREKSKSAAGSVGQEVDGSFKSEVSVEKKSCGDVELKYSSVTEPVNDDAEIQKKRKKKKKKRKKEEGIVIPETCEEEEAANKTVDLQMSEEKLEESVNGLEISDSSYVKKKKHKKKHQSSSNDAAQHGGEGADVSVCLDHSETSMKRKKIREWINSSNTLKENNKGDETNEGLESHSADLVRKKKKKKKKSETLSRDLCEDKVAQSDDSVSVQEKEKKRTSSFLVAEAEENYEKTAISTDEEELSGVMKKKKRRKMLVTSDNVEKYHEQSFEESGKTLPESTDTEVKRKKKRTGSELEDAADEGISPTREGVVMKKKKRKDKPESLLSSTEDVELVVLKKGKNGHSAETPHDGSRATDKTSEGMLNMAEHAAVSPGNHLNYNRDKKRKRKKALLEGKSLIESALLEPRVKKPSPVTCVVSETLSTFETSSSDSMKNKHRKLKRRLYNPSEDFLSDS